MPTSFIEFGQDAFLIVLVFVARRVNFCDESIEVRISSETSLGNELLTTRWTFFVSGAERGDDALLAESVETLFGSHGRFEDIQADGTH